MADDQVDISGMPPPPQEAQDDPTAGMPEPAALFKQHHGYEANSPEEVADFMLHPEATPDVRKAKSARYGLSELTGLPRAAAGAALAVPAAAASVTGQLSGALGAAFDPEHASEDLDIGRERGRRWAEKTYKLADYLPATKPGEELAGGVLGIPGEAGSAFNQGVIKPVLGENAAQAVGDVAQDVATDLPILGLPGAVRTGARGARAGYRAAKSALAETPPAEGTTYDAAGNAVPPSPTTEPPVGKPVTPESLRAQPNPIPPPEGTVAHARAAAAAPTPPPPAAGHARLMPDGSTAYTLTAEGVAAKRAAMTDAERTAYDRANRLPSGGETKEQLQARLDAEADARGKTEGSRSPGDAQRGSVRIFNSPKEEGPRETPTPEQQGERAANLEGLHQLSGGKLPGRRTAALTGDYNATGDDWQLAKSGSQTMQAQLASENDALHAAANNVHSSIGSEFDNSVDPTTLGDRGRVTRGAIQGIEKHFGDMTDETYDTARANSGDKPMPDFLKRASSFLSDDSNYMPEGFRKSAQARLNQLKTVGDNGEGDPSRAAAPSSIGAAEKFREWLNANRTLDNMHVVKPLIDHTDTDVSEHGGPGLFENARAMRKHQAQMLEEPVGIKKLLTPADSQGINHAIPEHKVMDYIADLPREQHEHVMNVLRAGAHLSPELAETSAQAIREIQAHMVSRIHAAATDDGGKWNARSFYNAASKYGRNAADAFKERPDVLKNLQTVNEAGNILHMDKSYPGAFAQKERVSKVGHALEAGGKVASSLVHDIPFVGRYVGRAIEGGVEGLAGKMSEADREKAVAKRIVDRTGKQRGSVGVLPQRDEVVHEKDTRNPDFVNHRWSAPNGAKLHALDFPDTNARYAGFAEVPQGERGKGTGTRMLQRAVDDTHAEGKVWRSDKQVSEGQAGAYKNLAKLGYDVKMKPHDNNQGAYHAYGDHVFEVKPGKGGGGGGGSTLNIGLHQGQEGEPGFRKMSKQEAAGAVESTGAKVTKSSVLTPDQHGVAEPTLVASTNRPLSEPEMQKVLAKTKQSAIPQRTDAGAESMHVAPGHEEIAKREGWDKFNPDYFRDHEPPQRFEVTHKGGSAGDRTTREDAESLANRLQKMGAKPEDVQIRDRAKQRGSVRVMNEKTPPREERNPRSEYNANRQISGKAPLTPEQEEIIRKLGGGQRGSVRVMNPKESEALPLTDKEQPANPSWKGQQPKPPEPTGAWYQDATSKQQQTLSKLPPTSIESRKLSLAPFSDDSHEVGQAAYEDHELAPGVRDVPLKDLNMSAFRKDRTPDLAKSIRESGQISPLHVGVGADGSMELLEGQHRARALSAMGHSSVPARVVVDMTQPKSLKDQRGSVRVMNEKPLAGAPEGDRPNAVARTAAAAYAKKAGIDYKPLEDYRFVDPKIAKNVADAYDEMKHDPTNSKVKASYDAFKAETLAQYKQMEKAGVKVDLDPSYPYKNPREMHADVRDNNHMSIYPTEAGFGSEGAAPTDHPLMEKAPVKMGGKDATYNDLFRAVHDYYGHAAEGNGFRANGEYNAWRAHRQMYSEAARGAMDAETLGQNSWVNSGPASAMNKGASGADTIYADQKAGLLPKAVVKQAETGVGADEHHITNQLTDDERNQLRTDTTKRLVDAFNSAPATKEYAAAALAGAAKRGWYRNSAQAIVNQFGHEAPRFAGLLSAMSPQVSVQTNFANALKTYINWDKAGRPEDPADIRAIMEQSSQKSAKAAPGSSNVLDAWVNNAVRALTADDPTNIKLSGPKVHSFYNNLIDNVNEVTNDAWMSSFAKIGSEKLGGRLNNTGPGKTPSYLALSAKVRDAARTISHLTGETWTPAEVQETVWSWAKTAYEHAEEKGSNVSIPDLVKNGDITDELIRSTPDFHQLFGTSEHRGLLQSSRFANNDAGVAAGKEQSTDTAGPSKARQAAQEALRPHLISAAERLESVRRERRAAGQAAPKEE